MNKHQPGQPLKVALIASCDYDPNAGVAGATVSLAAALQEKGAVCDTFFMDDLKTFKGNVLDDLLFPLKVALLKNKFKKYDVLEIATGDSWVLSLLPGRPIVIANSHGLENVAHDNRVLEAREGRLKLSWKYSFYHGGFRLWQEKVAFRRADAALLLNGQDLKYAVNRLGVPSSKAYQVSNGIRSGFINLPFEEIDSGEPIRIACVGSYIARKGIVYSVPALNRLLKRTNRVSVSFIGTRCEADAVLKDFDASVHGRIQIIPKYDQPNLPSLLKGHQILLFPSLSEGSPLTLLEAMACGTAPVVTDIPGINDTVTDGIDALVVPARSSEAIENALKQLLSDDRLRQKIRQNAYLTAQRYGWDNVAEARLSLYASLLEKRRGRQEAFAAYR